MLLISLFNIGILFFLEAISRKDGLHTSAVFQWIKEFYTVTEEREQSLQLLVKHYLLLNFKFSSPFQQS